MPPRALDRIPDAVRPRFDEIIGLTDSVCGAHLTEEYAVLARDLVGDNPGTQAAVSARSRPRADVGLRHHVHLGHGQLPLRSRADAPRQWS